VGERTDEKRSLIADARRVEVVRHRPFDSRTKAADRLPIRAELFKLSPDGHTVKAVMRGQSFSRLGVKDGDIACLGEAAEHRLDGTRAS